MKSELSTCNEETCRTAEKVEEEAWVRPHYELDRNDEAFRIRAYVPGANKSSVKISVEEGILQLLARRLDAPAEDWRPLSRESERHDYRLQVSIPEKVDAAAIKASVEDGILLLTLPIREADKPRTIEVR